MGGLGLRKKTIILISAVIIIVVIAGAVIGTSIIVRTNNKDFKKDPAFYKALGNYFAEQEDYDKAVIAYESCLLLSEDTDVRNNLAVIYHKQGMYSEAISQLRRLIINYPDNPSYHYDLAVNLVEKFRKTDEKNIADLEEALSEYEKAEELSPGYAHAEQNIKVLRRILGLEALEKN